MPTKEKAKQNQQSKIPAFFKIYFHRAKNRHRLRTKATPSIWLFLWLWSISADVSHMYR
jgi:hypothetical protein